MYTLPFLSVTCPVICSRPLPPSSQEMLHPPLGRPFAVLGNAPGPPLSATNFNDSVFKSSYIRFTDAEKPTGSKRTKDVTTSGSLWVFIQSVICWLTSHGATTTGVGLLRTQRVVITLTETLGVIYVVCAHVFFFPRAFIKADDRERSVL